LKPFDPAFKIADVFLCAEESTLRTEMKDKSLQKTAHANKDPPRPWPSGWNADRQKQDY